MRKDKNPYFKEKNPFPWVAFQWVLEKYGYYLTVKDISEILGFNRKDCAVFIEDSGVAPKLMPGGKSFRYAFNDLPEIINQGEKAQIEKFSKLSA